MNCKGSKAERGQHTWGTELCDYVNDRRGTAAQMRVRAAASVMDKGRGMRDGSSGEGAGRCRCAAELCELTWA